MQNNQQNTSIRDVWFQLPINTRITFIQNNIMIPTTKGTIINLNLTHEQKKWFLDGPLFEDYTKKTKFHNRIMLKIRNVGASLVLIACESVLCCWIYNKIFIPYVSSGEDQANELIIHAKTIIENCKFNIPLKGELKDQTKAEINFENGSRIKSFASNNPRGVRGPRALISYCLPYNQKILTDIGYVSIGDIVDIGIGKKVLSYNHKTNKLEWKKIKKRKKSELGNRRIIRINNSFECTEDHPVYNGREYIAASKLSKKDKLCRLYNNSTIYEINKHNPHVGRRTDNIRKYIMRLRTIKFKEKQTSTFKKKNVFNDMFKRMEKDTQERLPKEEKYVYNIEVEDNNNYFVNGFLVHNCDEYSFVKYPQEIMSAVEFMSSEGGQVNILSTVFGKQNLFWQIYSDKENFTNYHRHYITLFDNMNDFDVKESLYDYVKRTGAKLTCPWLSLDFLENKRKSDAPFQYANFLQEAVGVPVEEITAIITESMLNSYTIEEYLVEYRPSNTEGKIDTTKQYIISIDFGADRNVTAIVVLECKEGRFVVCYTETFNGNFIEQSGKIRNIIKRYDPLYIIGDETGMGGKNWLSILGTELKDGAVIGVNYSKKDIALEYGVDDNNKSFFIKTAIRLIDEGAMIVPKNHARLREELLGMQKIVYEKTVKYSGKNGPVGSDDLAMALLQVALLYNRIYEYGEDESADSADMNIQRGEKRKSNRERDIPRKGEGIYIEATGGKKNYGTDRITGFEKLI